MGSELLVEMREDTRVEMRGSGPEWSLRIECRRSEWIWGQSRAVADLVESHSARDSLPRARPENEIDSTILALGTVRTHKH